MTLWREESRQSFFENLGSFPLYRSGSLPPNNPPPETGVRDTRSVFRLLTPESFAFSLSSGGSTSDVIHERSDGSNPGRMPERERSAWNRRRKSA
jgi:hypothetical protein